MEHSFLFVVFLIRQTTHRLPKSVKETFHLRFPAFMSVGKSRKVSAFQYHDGWAIASTSAATGALARCIAGVSRSPCYAATTLALAL